MVKPIFQWIEPTTNFLFNGKNTFVETKGIPGVEKTGSITLFTIIVKLEMSRFVGRQQTILGHSGCGGYALVINDIDEVIFKARCTQNEFRTGYIIPLNVPVTLAIIYDSIQVVFYANGAIFNHQRKFSFKCDRNFDIGIYSEVLDEVWNGAIYHL